MLDFPDSYELPCKDGREIDLQPSDTDATAAGHAHSAIVIRILGIDTITRAVVAVDSYQPSSSLAVRPSRLKA